MTGSYKTDIGKLAYIGKQGVLCLLSESEYADRPGYTTPNNLANLSIVYGNIDKKIITIEAIIHQKLSLIENRFLLTS